MSWKSFACVAALSALITSPALAVPSLGWVDNGGSVTLQVTPSGTGSIAIEVAANYDGGAIDAAAVVGYDPVLANNANWQFETPGNNTLTGGTTNGLYTSELATGDVFASYGSNVFASATPVDLLTLDYSGSGTFSVTSLVIAENDVIITPTPALPSIAVGAPAFVLGDADGNGVVNNADINPFAQALVDLPGWTATYVPPANPLALDTNENGSFNNGDINSFVDILLGASSATATAVPEPSSAFLLASIAVAGFVTRRS